MTKWLLQCDKTTCLVCKSHFLSAKTIIEDVKWLRQVALLSVSRALRIYRLCFVTMSVAIFSFRVKRDSRSSTSSRLKQQEHANGDERGILSMVKFHVVRDGQIH